MSYERYHNIFDYYRGPSKGSDAHKNKVLENNVTKALLNTIDLCPNLGRYFISWLNEKYFKERGVSLNPPDITEIRIVEGPTDDEIRDKNITKILLGIKKHGKDYKSETRKGERVDGTIVGQGWLVAIESKLEGMDTSQLKAEQKRIRAEKPIQVLWKELKECFEKALEIEDNQSDKDGLFVDQFAGFLRSKGLIPFRGFKKRHFDYILKDQGQRSEEEKEDFKSLFKELHGELSRYVCEDKKRLGNLYWESDAQTKGTRVKEDDYAELRFYIRSNRSIPVNVTLWAERKKEHRAYLEVYADIEGERKLKRLAGRIGKSGDRGKLARKLQSSDFKGYYISLSYGDWKKDVVRYECTEITNGKLKELVEKTYKKANEKVHFVLAKIFVLDTPPDAEVTQLPSDAEGQLKEIAEALRALHPFVLFASGTPWEKITDW